jgi:hypothetical protein
MAMFTAYFDTSGNRRTSVLTVTGFVSRVEKWDRFDRDWKAILSREGVAIMHMTDFASSQKEFSGWRGQTERRRKFIADLSACIQRHTNKGFGSSVLTEDFDKVNARYRLAESAGSPFAMSVRACLGGLTKWAKRKHISTDKLLVAIESGDEDQSELIARARQDGFKVVPLDKSDVTAFQAGDVAAWKFRTAIHNITYGPIAQIEDAHNIIRSLEPMKRLVQNNGLYDEESLLALCEKAGVHRR